MASTWNKPIEGEESRPKRPARNGNGSGILHGAIAGIVIVGAGVAAWLWFSQPQDSEKEEPEKKSKLIEDVAKPIPGPVKQVADVPVKEKTKNSIPLAENEQLVNGFKVPKGARLVRNSLTNKQTRIFARATDTLIASYLQPPTHGVMPPPLPIPANAGKKFLESLDTPIEILKTDSPAVREMKETVIIARAQIKQLMDEGQEFESILTEHYKLTEENAKIRKDAQKELDAIYSSGDLDGATKYKRTMDLALQQMGIDDLDEPMTHAERKEQRHLENEATENALKAEQN